MFRMLLSMKKDVPPNPVNVGLFGADAVVLAADDLADSIDQTWF
jgi:hypothetical protein